MDLSQFVARIEPGSDPSIARPVDDATIKKITDALKLQGHCTYAQLPRTYTLLWCIGRPECIEAFQHASDNCFPYRDWTLPTGFRDSPTNSSFLQYQHVVFPDDLKGQTRPHVQFQNEVDCNLDECGILGHGYYGIVDRARGKLSKIEYARKRVRKAQSAVQRARVEAFEVELETLKRLRHHHLVQYVGSYTDPKWVAFMMLPIADCDLKEWMTSKTSKPSVQNVREAFGCLASAVSYLHQESVPHKDIKPDNILVHNGRVLLTDFGSSLDWKDMDSSTTAGTPEGFTRRYAAPEVLRDDKRNSSSDIFSLGCVFLELATYLFGHDVDELNQHCLSHGQKIMIFADNRGAIESWIEKIRLPEAPKADSKILDLIFTMMDPEKEYRPTASEISTIFGGLGKNYLCNSCLKDHLILDLERKNVNARDPKQRGPELCKAAMRGNLAIFQSLAKISDDMGYTITLEGVGATALDLAMKNGHMDIVKSFLVHSRAKGIPPNMRQAMFLAMEKSDACGINTLLDFGANVNVENEQGMSLMYTAVIQRKQRMVEILVARGAKLTYVESDTNRTVIHAAVRSGDPEILKSLLNRHQVNVNATDVFGMTALHEAVANGDRRLIDPLLQFHADPDICNCQGTFPLISAIRHSHVHLIKPLIAAGASIHLCNRLGEPPSCIAASMGAINALEILLDADGSLNHQNAKGENPLHLAVDSRNEALVDILLRKRPNFITEIEKERGMTPVHYAAYDGSTAILRKLLSHDRTPAREMDFTGRTPLLCAINDSGLTSTVQLLLDWAPATIDIACSEGNTPLMMAAAHRRVGIAQLLLDRGANPNAKNSASRTALHIAAGKDGSEETVKLLLAHGADANLPDANGCTALGAAAAAHRGSTMALLKWEGNADIDHCHEGSTQLMRAVASGNLEEVALVLKIGADVDARNHRQRTALFVAIEENQIEAVRLLLERNCDAGAKDSDHTTPLMLAASLGHEDIVRALVSAGVSLETQAENGNTALSKAADKGHAGVVKTLVNAGAETEVVDKDGLTPLFRAACRGHKRTASILVRAGADLASAKQIAKKSKVSGVSKAKKLLKELEVYKRSSG
ncbi:hypothetical protein MPH_00356 [Macrophomina phaseolina MS6]|uniref:Protein kinase domain-containing protein n=1 Tax=Macrophomina phaseolina (strain MS6) TaxID=1126212 RepID=K2SIH9_MACPH|nr:hypothetical protein MPH_00356 [Macrophomina phaseolina MS6]